MSDVPQFERPGGADQSAWLGRVTVQGLLMGVMFAASYWSFNWVAQLTQPKNASAQETLARQQAEYEVAAKKSSEKAAEMVARYEAILATQEVQLKRLDVVITAWEKQAGIAK